MSPPRSLNPLSPSDLMAGMLPPYLSLSLAYFSASPKRPPTAQPQVKAAIRLAACRSVKPSSWKKTVNQTMACQGMEPTMPCTTHRAQHGGTHAHTHIRSHKSHTRTSAKCAGTCAYELLKQEYEQRSGCNDDEEAAAAKKREVECC